MKKTLRLILGDQLNADHSWYANRHENVSYVMMEMRQETDYVKHHIQKILSFFAAMRAFTEQLREEGHHVIYMTLDDSENEQDLIKNIQKLVDEQSIEQFDYQLPDEYRLQQQLDELCDQLDIDTQAVDTEHFYTKRDEVKDFFKGKKTFIMENFYRNMRKKHGILMDGQSPAGGDWNFDKLNRKKYDGKVEVPNEWSGENDVSDLYELIQNQKDIQSFGEVDPKALKWPVTQQQARNLLTHFLKYRLEHFGTYEDALSSEHPVLFHAQLSFALNSKLISPQEVIDKAIAHWQRHSDTIKIQQIEGFVRQILGWREFMRGIYWAFMPDYKNKNFFKHERALPSWFWTGETKMSCLKHSIHNSLDNAYAHHIQRLMVIGNFALLMGADPDEVDSWYLGVYIDAIQWVEITNTRGMSQFADGGIIGTKPYISSSNYIKKMSDYCGDCAYSQSKKTGENACPFNSLYWHFLIRHQDALRSNQRMSMMYSVLDKMDPSKRDEVFEQAERYLESVETL